MADKPLILFAGGGSGGHIFPNVAILEQLRQHRLNFEPHFVVADRDFDHQLMAAMKMPYTPLLVEPYVDDVFKWWGWYRSWRSSVQDVERLVDEHDVIALISTGGFASGPPVQVCGKKKIHVIYVNLDAVPGKAAQWGLKYATTVFSVYDAGIERAKSIGLPLRRSSIGPKDKPMARKELGLDPNLETLLVVGGSQGAESVNKAMIKVLATPDCQRDLKGWQALHITGGKLHREVEAVYNKAGIPAKVTSFHSKMGLAWAAATIAVSRAGAGSVAEAWTNAAPTIFLPYPHHKDNHQRLNTQPLVAMDAAVVIEDRPNDVVATATDIAQALKTLAPDRNRLQAMAKSLTVSRPPDGAIEIAEWIAEILGPSS